VAATEQETDAVRSMLEHHRLLATTTTHSHA